MRIYLGLALALFAADVFAASNLVINAGFEMLDEKGIAAPWQNGRAWRFDRQGVDGTGAAVFDNADPKYYGGVSQKVSVKAGCRYAFGAHVRTEKLKGKATACLEWYGANGKYVGGAYALGVSGTTDWTEIRGSSTTIPTNAVRTMLQVYCERESVGKAVFDDVWLREETLPLVDGVYSSRYRNAASDGRVVFKAALNLPKGAEATAAGAFVVIDPERPQAVRRLPTTIADGAAVAECAVEDLALGENRIEFTLSKVPGHAPVAKRMAFTRLSPERERALKVRFDAFGRTIVDGKPYFPLGMYWSRVERDKLDVYRDSPFNCLMPYNAPNCAQMDLCAERGLKVIYNVVGKDLSDGSIIRRFREHPALLAWYLNDERPITLRKELTAARQYLEAYDPDHPGWIAIYQHGEVREYLPTFDVVGTDPYPLYRWPIGMVTEWTRDTRKGLMDLKPMWQIPQVFDKGAYASNRKIPGICKPPTFDDMRNMAWQCLACGAKGLVFYSFFDLYAMDKTTPFEKRWGDVKRMAEEIRRYVPFFLSTERAPTVIAEDARVAANAWRHGGCDLVVAVNTTRETVRTRLKVGSKVREVELAPIEVRFLDATVDGATPGSLAAKVPELMRTNDGSAVTSASAWEKVRRPELLETFVSQEYGRRPVEKPDTLRFEAAEPDVEMMGGNAVRRRIRVSWKGPLGSQNFVFTAFIPKTSANSSGRPTPAFLLICNRSAEENIDPSRVRRTEFWPAEEIVSRGYAALAFWNGDVAPDRRDGGFTNGVYTCWARERTDDSWGALSAWAWGASRVMDWIETEPRLDAKRVAVIGHSRGGKTALVAGVTDTRFAMACVNDSGCSGAKLNRLNLPQSEHIASITRNFPHWFCRNYVAFAGRELEMPFDQHQMVALMAPRALAIGSASGDAWAGPLGEYESARLGSFAWELYGRRGLVSDAFPEPNEARQEGWISYHYRAGDHDLTLHDWNRYMDFADRLGWRK